MDKTYTTTYTGSAHSWRGVVKRDGVVVCVTRHIYPNRDCGYRGSAASAARELARIMESQRDDSPAL